MYADEQPNFLHINQQVATPSFTFTTKSLGSSASKAPKHHHSQSRHDDHDADEVPTSLYRTSVSRAAAPSEARSGYGGDEPSWRAGSVMLGDEGDYHHNTNRHASFSERFSSVLSAPLPASLQTSSRGAALPAHHQQASGRTAVNHSHSSRAGSAASTSRGLAGKPQTVHDSLYEQGRLYKAMREELQAKAAKEELKKVTGSPSVSRYANEKAMERRKRLGRPEDVVERMEAATNAARAKTDKKRQEVLERRRRQQEEEDFGITSAASEDESCFGDVTMPSHHDSGRHQQPASKGSRRASSATALRAASGGSGHGTGPRKSILRAGSSNRPATRTLSFSPGAKARTTMSGVSGTSHRPAANVSPGHQRTGSSRRRTRTPFQPRLTEKGRNAEAKVTAPEYLAQHQHRAQQRADAHRTDRLLKDLQQCRDVPEITLRSKELTQRRAEREGTAGLSYIDAMLERDRISKEALAQKAEQRRIEENHFHPRITAYAATLGQGGGDSMGVSSVMRASQQSHAERARMDVAERLYADSFAMEERRAERARKIDGQRSGGTNKANSRTSSVNRDGGPHVPVGDRLLRQHEEAMRERQRRIAEEDELTRLTSRPAIDPVSAAITARLPETAQERLLGSRSGAGGASSRFQQQQYEEAALESRAMPPRRVLSQEEEERMLYKLHNYDERRREKLRQLQSEREEEELAECTFRPNTTNTYYTSETHFDSAPPGEDADRNHMHFTQFDTQALADQENRDPEPSKQSSWRDVSIVERNAQWAAQRNARLEAQRSELKDKEVEGCTFKPEVQSGRNPPAAAAPKHTDPLDPRSSVSTGRSASTPGTIYGGDGTPWGVHEYLARQQYARYLQLEKEYKLTGKRPPPPPQPFDPASMYQSNDDDMEGSIVSSSTEGNRPSLSPQPRGGRGGDNYETESVATRSAPSQPRPPTQGGPIASLRPPSGPGDVRGLLDVSHDFAEEDGSLSNRRGASLLVPPSMR